MQWTVFWGDEIKIPNVFSPKPEIGTKWKKKNNPKKTNKTNDHDCGFLLVTAKHGSSKSSITVTARKTEKVTKLPVTATVNNNRKQM